MSETLSSQDLKDLQEMPNTLELGELRKITTLQDVSLAEGVGDLQLSNERKLKTNSLKRFFRLSPKKKQGDESLEAAQRELQIEVADQRNLDSSLSKASLKSSLSGYWNTIFKTKKSGKSTKRNSEIEMNLNEASSKLNASDNNSSQTNIENSRDNVSNTEEKYVEEEIQNLKITEECSQKSNNF